MLARSHACAGHWGTLVVPLACPALQRLLHACHGASRDAERASHPSFSQGSLPVLPEHHMHALAGVDHGREPCPYRILGDIGGAFGMGAVGGGIWHLVKGTKNSPSGARLRGGLEVSSTCLHACSRSLDTCMIAVSAGRNSLQGSTLIGSTQLSMRHLMREADGRACT